MTTAAAPAPGPHGPRCAAVRAIGLAAPALAAVLSATPLAGQLAVDRLEMMLRVVGDVAEPGIIGVRNGSAEAVQATIDLEDWDRAEDGGNRWHEVGSVPGACTNRLDVFPRALSLDPGEAQSVRVTFTGDGDLERECWGAVIFSTVRPPPEGGAITHVIRTAVKVYVPPVARRPAAEVVAIEVAGPAIDGEVPEGDGPTEVRVTFRNTGNVHVVSRATLQVRSADNELVHELDFPPSYLLPGARGRVSVPLPDLESGRYVLLAIADYDGPELAAAQVEHEVR